VEQKKQLMVVITLLNVTTFFTKWSSFAIPALMIKNKCTLYISLLTETPLLATRSIGGGVLQKYLDDDLSKEKSKASPE